MTLLPVRFQVRGGIHNQVDFRQFHWFHWFHVWCQVQVVVERQITTLLKDQVTDALTDALTDDIERSTPG